MATGAGGGTVLLSHDIFAAQATGGISRAMIELATALPAVGMDSVIWAGRHRSALLHAVASAAAPAVLAAEYRPAAGRLRLMLHNEPAFARFVRLSEPAIVHRTYYSVIDRVARRPHVETLHDMWDERSVETSDASRFLRSQVKKRALERADAIVCVSRSTLNEMTDIWPHLAGRAVVIPHGVRRLSTKPHFIAPRPYFLFVGQRGHYKNFAVAVAGLAAAGLSNHDLICFGGGRFTTPETAMIAAHGLTGLIQQTGGGDDVLAGAYEGATALLYPSAYEGFGLPLLEAMTHRCPVIAAPLTSLPEVGGAAAQYADPRQTGDWGDTMARLARNPGEADELRQRGREHANRFTWAATAQRHADLYRQLT